MMELSLKPNGAYITVLNCMVFVSSGWLAYGEFPSFLLSFTIALFPIHVLLAILCFKGCSKLLSR